MNRRLFAFAVLATLLLAVPVSASQFVRLPFDQVASEATYIVRGTLGPVTSAWDDAHEVIYSSAVLRVNRYLDGFGPQTLVVREAGGTVDGYTQEAIGFPVLREGEEIVLFLSQWEDGTDWRIHAYNQGKFLVRQLRGVEMLVPDSIHQGEAGFHRGLDKDTDAVEDGISINEFVAMVKAARTHVTPFTRR